MLPAKSLEARLVRLTQSRRLRAETFAEITFEETAFLLQAFAWGDNSLPTVCVIAGVHGDEPCGVEAAVRLLELLEDGALPLARHRLLILPCLNPSGLAEGTRANRVGQDINRQFYDDHTPESAAIRRFLDPRQLAALVDLHVDLTASGYYLFELRREGVPPLASAILTALATAGFPLEERPFYAGYLGERGLFAPTADQVAEFQRSAPGQSLAEWAWANGVPRSYPLEAPVCETSGQSAEMHVTALLALFAALEEAGS